MGLTRNLIKSEERHDTRSAAVEGPPTTPAYDGVIKIDSTLLHIQKEGIEEQKPS